MKFVSGKIVALLAFFATFAVATNYNFILKNPSYTFDFSVDPEQQNACFVIPAPRFAPLQAIQYKPLTALKHYGVRSIVWGIPFGSNSIALNTTLYPGGIIPDCHAAEGSGWPRMKYVYTWGHGAGTFKFDDINIGQPFGNQTEIEYYMLQLIIDSRGEEFVDEDLGFEVRLTDNIRPLNAELFVTGTEHMMVNLPPRQHRVIFNASVPYPAPYYDLLYEEGNPFFAPDNLERVYDRVGDSFKFIYGFGHANKRGIDVAAIAWRNGTIPMADAINIEHYLAHAFEEEMPNYTMSIPQVFGVQEGTPEIIDQIDFSSGNEWHALDFVFRRGDSYSVTCTYSTLQDTEVVHGEFTDAGELCNYVFYYIAVEPGQNVPETHGNVVPVNFFYNWLDGNWVNGVDPSHHH